MIKIDPHFMMAYDSKENVVLVSFQNDPSKDEPTYTVALTLEGSMRFMELMNSQLKEMELENRH